MHISQLPIIGVFGGTFDPIHLGHLRTVSSVQSKLALARVLIVPVYHPPHRTTPLTDSKHRVSMIELAINEFPKLECDDREILRGGISYTYLTAQELRKEFGESPLCLIIGLDSFLDLPGWHCWDKILDNVHIVVMNRPGWRLPYPLPKWCHDVVIVDDPVKLKERSAGYVYCISVPSIDINSTMIRDVLLKKDRINNTLPSSVLSYIRSNKLYESH